MDDLHGDESAMQMPPDGKPAYHPQMHFMEEQEHDDFHHLSNGDMIHHGEHDDIGVGQREGMNGDVGSDPRNMSDNHSALVAHGSVEETNQLTLSFQGQVYVFDSVSPEKVQAVLLLLGGRETSTSMPYISLNQHQNNRDLSSNPQRFNVPQRLASLIRFREKRKERNFEKKIRYTVRKEVALRMQRNKGQFTSSKPVHEDSASAATSWDSNQSWRSDGNGSQHQETACRHCGVNEKATPMMRKGPDGPRTLCNACGLMWANKGSLRDLSKAVATTPGVGKKQGHHHHENGNAHDSSSS